MPPRAIKTTRGAVTEAKSKGGKSPKSPAVTPRTARANRAKNRAGKREQPPPPEEDEDEDDDEAEANSPERVLDPHMLVELDPLLTSDRIGVDSEVWDVSAAPVAAAGRERTSHRT